MSNVNRIIQDLIDEGALVDWQSFRSGTAFDWSGNGNHGALTDVIHTGAGAQFLENTSSALVSDNISIRLTEGCALFLCDGLRTETEGTVISKRDAGGTNYHIAVFSGANTIGLFDGSDERTITYTNGTRLFGINFESGTSAEGFEDGVSIGNFSGINTITTDDAPLYIGNRYNNSQNFSSNLSDVLIINRKLTATEHALLYDALENTTWENLVHYVSGADVAIHPSEPGLVAGYNMIPENGLIKDVSDNGNDGTITGGVSFQNELLGNTLRTHGTPSSNRIKMDGFTSTSGDYTFAMWVKSDQSGTIKYLFDSQTDRFILAWQNTVSKIGFYDGTWHSYIDAPNDNLWHFLTFVFDSSALKSILYIDGEKVFTEPAYTPRNIGGNVYLTDSTSGATSHYAGLLSSFQIFEEVKDLAWVQKQYNRGKTAMWSSAFGAHESSAATTSGPLENLPLYVDSGSFKCAQATINDIPGISVKCVSAGTLSVPTSYFRQTATEAAYGKWEWWMRKGGGLNTIRIYFINTSGDISATPTGYNFQFTADERAKIEETGVGNNFQSATGYISINTWYKCTVTRDGEDELRMSSLGI
jgi:hypothetical protein